MSGRHWLHAIALGIVVAFGSPALGQDAVSKQEGAPKSQVDKKPTEAKPPQKAAPHAPSITPLVAPTKPTGADHDKKASPNTNNNPGKAIHETEAETLWRDTIAQWIMAVTGLLALAVSGWAVWLVKETLTTNMAAVAVARKSNKIAREMASADRRPWLSARLIRAYGVERTPDGNWTVTIDLMAANSGRQPALDVVVGPLVNISPIFLGDRLAELKEGMKMALPYEGQIIFPNSEWPLRAALFFNPAHNEETVFNGFFGGWVQYRFDGDPGLHFTPFVYQLSWSVQMGMDNAYLESQPHGIAPT